MTGVIMVDWLRWFDSRMSGRKVLLLIDGFSAHKTALDMLNNDELQNTRVEILPPNVTSIYQPCDQGIINMLKVRYKKLWLQALVQATFDDTDAFKNTTILQAVHWAIQAWNDVPADNISNCWVHSQLLGPRFGPQKQPEDWHQIEAQECAMLMSELNISAANLLGLESFLHPRDEIVVDSSEDILSQVAESHSQVEEAVEEEEDMSADFDVSISHHDAHRHAQALILYAEQQDTKADQLASLRNLQRQIFQARVEEKSRNRVQTTIRDFFQAQPQ